MNYGNAVRSVKYGPKGCAEREAFEMISNPEFEMDAMSTRGAIIRLKERVTDTHARKAEEILQTTTVA